MSTHRSRVAPGVLVAILATTIVWVSGLGSFIVGHLPGESMVMTSTVVSSYVAGLFAKALMSLGVALYIFLQRKLIRETRGPDGFRGAQLLGIFFALAGISWFIDIAAILGHTYVPAAIFHVISGVFALYAIGRLQSISAGVGSFVTLLHDKEALDAAACAEDAAKLDVDNYAQLQRIAEHIPGVLWEVAAPWKENGWEVEVSVGKALARFGLKPNEMCGRDIRDLIHPHEVACYEKIFSGESEKEEYENVVDGSKYKGGGSTWHVTLRVILQADKDENGRICGVTAYATEITPELRSQIEADMKKRAISELMNHFGTPSVAPVQSARPILLPRPA